ncbi:hypothetical protein HDV04_005769 [Boothiomyces sp. JEL0838]|nr:hypothetical protein HDV04_005769 [Boothiomyces sp. JEL0838]
MDVTNFLSGVVLGITFHDIGIEPLLQRKKIPILIFLSIITAFFYILGYEIQARTPLDPGSPAYIGVGIMMAFVDATSSIPYVYALISRLVAILPNHQFSKYLYLWMIVPILYPIVDVYTVLVLIGYPVNPALGPVIYAIGNIAFGITFFVLDLCVTFWLFKYQSKQELIDYFPLIAGVLFIANAVAATIDTNIDACPFYLAYAIDVLAYQQVSRRMRIAMGAKKDGPSNAKESVKSSTANKKSMARSDDEQD